MSSSAVFRNNNDISNWLKKNSSWKSNQKHASVSIFNCPVEFFASTTVEPEALEVPAESKVESDAPVARGLTCLTCGLRFGDVKEQQQHFKSDLHVVNARRKVRGLPPVATAEDDRSLFFEQEVALVRQKSNELEEELHNNGVVFHASSSSSSESESNEGEGGESDSEDAEEVNSVVSSAVATVSVSINNQKTDVSSKERGSRKGGGGRRSKKQQGGEEREKDDDNNEGEEDQSLALNNDKPCEYSDNCGRIHKKFNSHQGPVLYFTRSESEHKAADTQQKDTTHISPSTTFNSTPSPPPLHWSVGISTALFPRNSIFATNDWVFAKPEDKSPWTATFESLTALKQNPMVAVLLLRSGRFSGAVFEGKTLLIHKNCRRYTIRGKAGGSQSSHDNKGGKAKSAGANMRRQGEMDLKSDIEQCIQLWQPLLQTCQLILVSAPKHMRNGSLFSVEQRKNTVTTAASANESHPNKPASAASALSTLSSGPIAATMTALNQLSLTSPYVLHKEDPRIQYVPFLCDKPSLEECKKVFETATTVHFQGCSEEEEREREGAKQKDGEKNEIKASTSAASMSTSTSFSQATPSSLPSAVVPVAIKLPACTASKNIFSLLTSSCNPTVNQQKAEEELYEKVEAILKIVSGEDGDPATRLSLTQGYSPSAIVNMLENADSMNTMLHIVSVRGLSSLVPLFLSHGASPLLTDSHNRTPYFVAKDKNVRDAFRRFRAEEEDRWDWNAAGVGAALSEEAEQLQKQKEKEKKKKQQLRKKEEKKVEEETKRKEEEAARLEEIRIREEIKRLGSCSQCGTSLIGKIGILSLTPDKKCCSADCMSKLKRKMTADAAMARYESARAASRK